MAESSHGERRGPKITSPTGCASVLIMLTLFAIIVAGYQLPQRVTVEDARERFIEMTGDEELEVIRHTNNLPVFGNPQNVTFELQVNGVRMSGNCEDKYFSPMVCRLYNSTEE